MTDRSGLKKALQITIMGIMLVAALAAIVYNLPLAESAGAYDISLTVDSASKEVSAGSQITYTFTITNDGTNADKYTITSSKSSSPSTWTVSLSKTTTGTISSSGTETFTATVRAPSNATVTDYCDATVKVTSQTDPTNSTQSILISTSIKRSYGVSITSPGLKNLAPGSSAVYSFTVKNEGNDKDKFSLEATSYPAGWPAPSIDWDTGEITPGSTKAATLTVNAPTDAKAGAYSLTVKAQSLADSTVSATRSMTANVTQVYKLSITSEGSQEVDIMTQRSVTFPIRITNLGNGEDQFSLTYYVPSQFKNAGWGGDISTTTTSKVLPDKSINVSFYAYTPTKSDNPPVNSKGEFYINATSVGNPTVVRQVKISCVVLPYYDVMLDNTGPSSKSGDPTGTIIFTFNVTNKGNDLDTYTMDLDFPTGFEDSSIEPSSFSLAAGLKRTVTITINPDETIVKAKSYRFTLFSNSSHGPSANSVFFVTINKNFGAYLDAPEGSTVSSGQPGGTYKIPVRIQNKGNGIDTFDLSVQGETTLIDTEWSPLISASVTPQMQSDDWFSFNVTVTAPSNATMGTYRFRVDASSVGGSITKTLWLSVRIPQLYNVDISANKESIKGEYSNSTGTPVKVTYILDVYNKGSGEDDSISIAVKSAPTGFAGRYSIFFTENTKSKITIPESSSKQAKLEIEMPTVSSGVLADTYFFVVEASSDNGTLTATDDKFAEIELSLLLQPKHAVTILTGVNSSQVRLGNEVKFSVIIQNRGTVDDYYQLSYEYPNYGQNVKFSIPNDNLTTRILKPLEQETIILTATILSGANPNWGSVWVKVIATHPTDFTIKAEKYFTAIFADDFSGDLATTDNFEQALPGGKAWYNVTLRNTGTRSSDTFTISLEGTSDFDNIEIRPSVVTMAPNVRVVISINISVPAIEDKIINSGTYDLSFKAVSKGETNLDSDDITVDNVTLKIKVLPVYKIQMVIPEGSATSDVGKTLPPVKINVTNKGNEPSTVQISLASSTPTSIRSWVTISPSTVSDLAPKAGRDVSATIKVPTSALAGKQVFTFQADVVGQTATVTSTFELVVNDNFKLELTVPDGTVLKEAEPTESVSFLTKLTNKGNTIDSVDIELSSTKRGWATFGFKNGSVESQDTTAYNLGREGSRDIWLKIDIEENAPAGEQSFTIKATSKGDDAISASITLRVDVEPNRQVELITNKVTEEVIPDVDKSYTEVEYSVQVVNKGEAADSFKLEVVSANMIRPPHLDADQWDDVLKSDHPTDVTLSKVKTGSIAKGSQETITVTVRVQKSYYTPGSFNTVIWAISEGDPGTADDRYSQPLQLITKVKQAYGAEILIPNSVVDTDDKLVPDKLVATFEVRAKNTGTGIDSYKIEIKDNLADSDFSIKTSESFKTGIASEAYTSIMVTIEMDTDTPKGQYSFEVRWISKGDDLEYVETEDYVTTWEKLTFNVIQTYGVDIVANTEEKEVEVGDNAEFKLTVKNLGNYDDNFRVDVKNDKNLNWATSSKTRFTLGGRGSATQETEVIIKVSVPRDRLEAISGYYYFNVSVYRDQTQTREQDKARDYIELRVDVDELYEHIIDTDDDVTSAEPGETISYRFEVENKGNVRDSYELAVKGDRKEWGKLSATRITMNAGDYRIVYLNVTVPAIDNVDDIGDIEARNYDFLIEVDSLGDRDALPQEVTFTTDVEQVFGVNIPPPQEGSTQADPKEHDVNSRDAFTIKFDIENTGNDGDTFQIQKPTTLISGWSIEVSPSKVTIPIGQESTITVTIRFTSDSDFYAGVKGLTFTVTPDDGSVYGKAKKQTVTLWVRTIAPDLVINDGSLEEVPSASELKIGEQNTITVTVTNAGTARADDVTVRMLDNGREVASDMQDVGVGQTVTFEFKWTPKTGSHTLKFVANDGFVLIEGDQNNNEKSISRNLSPWSLNNSLIFYLLVGFLVLLLIALAVVGFLFMNKNREAKELAARIKAGDLGLEKGGPRKLLKETPGTPSAKGPALPAATPAALGPAKDVPGAKKEPVRVKCPECNTEQVFSITQRPAEVQCKTCGVLMRIPEKKK